MRCCFRASALFRCPGAFRPDSVHRQGRGAQGGAGRADCCLEKTGLLGFAFGSGAVGGFTGVGIGVALIIIDFILKKSSGNRLALPVLAVGMGIYLPPSVNMPIVVGAFLAAWLKSRIRTRSGDAESSLKRADRTGTLFAAGLIVGESLIGVAMAFVIAVSVTNGGSDAPLALGLKNWDTAASWLGLAGFLLGMTVFARRILKAAR